MPNELSYCPDCESNLMLENFEAGRIDPVEDLELISVLKGEN